MTYPQNIEEKIGFDQVRRMLMGACSSTLGQERVESDVCFCCDFDHIRRVLATAREMQVALADPALGFPRGQINDIRESLHRVRIEGLYLVEEELLALQHTLQYAVELEHWLAGLDEKRFLHLRQVLQTGAEAAGTSVLTMVVRMIDGVLDRYGRLSDNASPELHRIRREIAQAQGSVGKALQQILRQAQAEGYLDKDVTPTLREGRLVLPVPPAYKRKIGGIVHDESATGKTVFIEPPQVVEANNRIRELESEEQRERIRILTEVTSKIRPATPAILQSSQMLAEMDLLLAKCHVADEMQAIAPEVMNQPGAFLREARHPLLYLNFKKAGKEVVPLTLSLGEKRILIISGPNAGGKSVCLKTVALLQYMAQCGLMVPVREDSVMGVYEHLMIDIGDEQSIEDDLSTYSSHLRNMKAFVRMANKQSLFLIDEFGTGTEPLIGGAIAEAVLDQLREAGAMGVVTTHYTNLKHYAEQHDGVINGAMLYDRGALRPLFQLSVGQAGSSFAIEIARQIGLPEAIVKRATDLVGEEHIDYDKQLQDIARDKRYWANKRENIRQREKHLEEKIAYYEQEIAGLKAKKKEIIGEANTEAARILEASNATIERTIREIKEAKAEKGRTRKARERVEEMKEKVESGKKNVEIGKKKEESGKKVMRDFRDLKMLTKDPTRYFAETGSGTHIQTTVVDELRRKKLAFNRTLDLRGMRADEALEVFIAYLDDAIMVQAGEVTILHGTGTGAIKQVVRDYLNGYNRQLRKRGAGALVFHDGDVNTGGAGLTVIEI